MDKYRHDFISSGYPDDVDVGNLGDKSNRG